MSGFSTSFQYVVVCGALPHMSIKNISTGIIAKTFVNRTIKSTSESFLMPFFVMFEIEMRLNTGVILRYYQDYMLYTVNAILYVQYKMDHIICLLYSTYKLYHI